MRVGVVGLGPIGIEVAKAVAGGARGLTLAAAVDVAPGLVGKRLEEVVGAGATGVVDGTLEAGLGRGVEAIALCTSSRVEGIVGDAAQAVAAGVHVVSTCEELASPGGSAAVKALDEAARSAGVTVIGTGVNPGFVMDRLVLEVAAMCVTVRGVKVRRVVDAAKRRGPLRKKVGHGLSTEEFRAGVEAGRLGHVGLRASAELIARGLGGELARAAETVEPVVDEKGMVLGVFQHLTAEMRDGRPIELTLQMSVGAEGPEDRVVVDGDPPMEVVVQGGTQGDRATVAAVVDGLGRLGRAKRGVITVVEMY